MFCNTISLTTVLQNNKNLRKLVKPMMPWFKKSGFNTICFNKVLTITKYPLTTKEKSTEGFDKCVRKMGNINVRVF